MVLALWRTRTHTHTHTHLFVSMHANMAEALASTIGSKPPPHIMKHTFEPSSQCNVAMPEHFLSDCESFGQTEHQIQWYVWMMIVIHTYALAWTPYSLLCAYIINRWPLVCAVVESVQYCLLLTWTLTRSQEHLPCWCKRPVQGALAFTAGMRLLQQAAVVKLNTQRGGGSLAPGLSHPTAGGTLISPPTSFPHLYSPDPTSKVTTPKACNIWGWRGGGGGGGGGKTLRWCATANEQMCFPHIIERRGVLRVRWGCYSDPVDPTGCIPWAWGLCVNYCTPQSSCGPKYACTLYWFCSGPICFVPKGFVYIRKKKKKSRTFLLTSCWWWWCDVS